MKLSLSAQIYLAFASLLFFVDTTFKGFRHSLPIFTPGLFLMWIKVNIVTGSTKWLTLYGAGFVFEWTPRTTLLIGLVIGILITIITLPRFKVLFIIDGIINHIFSGKNVKKPS